MALSLTDRDSKEKVIPLLNDSLVKKTLSQMVRCSQNDLVDAIRSRVEGSKWNTVTLSGDQVSKRLTYGYHTFTVPKNTAKSEFRTISVPSDSLKRVQKGLLNTLRAQVATSSAVAGGELGTSPKKNALRHLHGSYLYTTDIKSAYPSVQAQRVYANLFAGLQRYFDFSFPYLTRQQREHVVSLMTTLTTYGDQIPQGAPTSSRILNIVMAKCDADIFKGLFSENSLIVKPVYSRYIDDLAISFKGYADSEKVKQVYGNAIKKVEELNQLFGGGKSADSVQKAIQLLADISETVGSTPSVPNLHEKRRFLTGLSVLKEKLEDAKTNEGCYDEVRDSLYQLIGTISRRQNLVGVESIENSMEGLQQQIKKIVNANGWTLKTSKDKTRDPTSPTAKEITGVTIDKEGRLGISRKKINGWVNLAKTACMSPSSLDMSYLTPKGDVDGVRLAYVLNGVRSFILDVKGNVPAYFEKRYIACVKKYFPHMGSKRVKTAMVNSGGMIS